MLVAALLLGGAAFLLLGGWPVVDGENRSELLAADWNGEWMRLQAARRRADDSFEWDKRARHFRPLEAAPYARDFIKLLALKPGESVLDMGCGAGSIAIPLAQAGHPVIAADFPLPCWARLMPALSTMGSRIALHRLSLLGMMIGIWLDPSRKRWMLPLPVGQLRRPI